MHGSRPHSVIANAAGRGSNTHTQKDLARNAGAGPPLRPSPFFYLLGTEVRPRWSAVLAALFQQGAADYIQLPSELALLHRTQQTAIVAGPGTMEGLGAPEADLWSSADQGLANRQPLSRGEGGALHR